MGKMVKPKNHYNHNNKEKNSFPKRRLSVSLPGKLKSKILAVLFWLFGIILVFSFFDQAGKAGSVIFKSLQLFLGKAIFLLPLTLFFAGLVFFLSRYEKFISGAVLAIFLLILGPSVLIETLKPGLKYSGLFGLAAKPFLKFFGFWVTEIIFGAVVIIGGIIFWYLLRNPNPAPPKEGMEKKKSLISRIFKRTEPAFKIKELEPLPSAAAKEVRASAKEAELKVQTGQANLLRAAKDYQFPPLDLLETDKGSPTVGDIKMNSAIIKKTLENFGIPVEMSEVNIGPTVTQYTLKPAEGIKLSKITSLSNDLALALAAHPIRIEAPIPGKPLVGIELPNKVRAQVRLRDLLSNSLFQNSFSTLALCLGRDVSGAPVYADLTKMPHLLVAGATGTGKTIFLNNIVASFLYRNSPEVLRLILVDPKRVEFPVYDELPHLLCPVILDPQKTVNALRWLVGEMERRFKVLSGQKTRDIKTFNELALRNKEPLLPYIVIIIDELADLMAAKGKEVEGPVVRLAQMARAVGIHLIVATQRPSVEVITGLIKANITSRVTFQVASQVDSRTVLDSAGAEKLLGQGDLLFISAEVVKPKRIQGAFVSDKEVKKVVSFINENNKKLETEKIDESLLENNLSQSLEGAINAPGEFSNNGFGGDDPLYEEAKRIVFEAKKASASLLQRRLRVGYARAARLIDILEEKGVVGPAEGAKPRTILADYSENKEEEGEANNTWKKV